MGQAKNVVLTSEVELTKTAQPPKEVPENHDDTDSDGLDCLVAHETLQYSTDGFAKRKSPEIRKITKKSSFLR